MGYRGWAALLLQRRDHQWDIGAGAALLLQRWDHQWNIGAGAALLLQRWDIGAGLHYYFRGGI